jgi:iron complex outermembrane receptor protein
MPFNPRFIIVILLFVLSSQVQAQADVEPEYSLDAVEVTGHQQKKKHSDSTKMDVDLLETPGSIVIFDHELIEAQGSKTLGEVLKNDASIATGNVRRNRERFYLRGFVLEPDQSYLRDGQQHLSRYKQPVELYESIEVLKGPSALFYGKSTPGGMINMITKRPDYENHFSFTQELASFNSKGSLLDVSGPITDGGKLRSRLILSSRESESWRQYHDGSSPQHERFVGAFMLDYDISDHTSLAFTYDRTVDKGGLDMGPKYDSNNQRIGAREMIWDMPWSKRDSEVENIGMNLTHFFNHQWHMTLGANQQRLQRRTTESLRGKINSYDPASGDYKLKAYDSFETFDVNTAYMDFNGYFSWLGVRHNFLFGANIVDYQQHKQEHQLAIEGQGNIHSGAIIPRPEGLDYRYGTVFDPIERISSGIYVQDMVEINDRWHVLAGLRLDQEKTQASHSANLLPKLAVIHHPSENASLYLTYSESFDPKDPINNSSDINFGKSLDAVRGESYEVGGKWELLDSGLMLTAALFDIRQNNKVITEILDNPIEDKTQITTQVGQQHHRGIELNASGQLAKPWSLHSSLMYLQTEMLNDPKYGGNQAVDAPQWTASLWSNYGITEQTHFNAGAHYVGQRYGDSANTFLKEDYIKFDLGLSHQLRFDNKRDLLLRLNIDNLFNTHYIKGGCSNNAMIGMPRTLKASIKLNF